MSPETELTAILTAAAIAPITDRAFLRITGSDATRWLNGMVTNNIKDLRPGEGNYNFLLNAQGRIQGDCSIYRESGDNDPSFLLETDAAQLEPIHALLEKFIIMDDVELLPHFTKAWGLLLLGIDSRWLRNRFVEAPSESAFISGRLDGQPVIILTKSSNTTELWFNSATAGEYQFEMMRSEGVVEVSPAALEAYRILSGTPRYGTDIRNTDTAKDLPQETAQTHALNFNKGCYLGQEIVERIHSRGQVHRTFARFELKPTSESQDLIALPTLPCALTLDGKSVGELTSAALIPLTSGPTLRALGYIRREAATATLTYPGGTATVLPAK